MMLRKMQMVLQKIREEGLLNTYERILEDVGDEYTARYIFSGEGRWRKSLDLLAATHVEGVLGIIRRVKAVLGVVS